jgi:hypothetical protein
VLRVDPGSRTLTARPLGDSSQVAIGERVVAIGNPLGVDFFLTQGIVSGIGRNLQACNGAVIPNGIQTDAAINQDNSAGPLIDQNGDVIGVDEQIASPSGEEAKRVLRRALDLGVDFIDTADSYGPRVSEELIAEALHAYPQGLVIATKGGLLRGETGEWPADGRPEHLREALEGSLRTLRLERIDLHQFHRPDPEGPIEESIGALDEVRRRRGKTRHIGVSSAAVASQRAEYPDEVPSSTTRRAPVASTSR